MPDMEHDLLRDAQNGDMDAYEDLQRRLEPDIRRFVARLINDPIAADDVVQEVFIAFYQNLHRINPVENLRPYIFRMARNRCYDTFRRNGRYDELSLDDEPVQIQVSFTQAHHQPKPDDLTHWMLLHLEVQEAIDQLPEVQRQALILYSEEHMSYAEIADIMDVSVGTVKSRLYYAKKNLRGYLRPETLAVLDEEFGADNKQAKPSKQTHKSTMQQQEFETDEHLSLTTE